MADGFSILSLDKVMTVVTHVGPPLPWAQRSIHQHHDQSVLINACVARIGRLGATGAPTAFKSTFQADAHVGRL